jgi:type II secretory ATPase GspE/PulE/Tfp pilus assembly ATPase PilB-like protein
MLSFSTEDKQVAELKSQEAEALAEALAGKYKLTYIDLSKFAINTDALGLIPEGTARTAHLAGFKLVGKNLHLVLAAPNDPKTEAVLTELRDHGWQLTLYLGSLQSLERAWERYREISQAHRTEGGVINIGNDEINAVVARLGQAGDVKKIFTDEIEKAGAGGGVSSLLEVILAGGIATGASDIHIEPQAETVRLRYRLDGVLEDIAFFPSTLLHQLLARVKLISGLKLNVSESAQDGRFSIRVGETDIEIRASVLPGAYGESLVLRLLNPETIAVSLEELGMEPALLEIIKREIARPNGMILLTGPTGSGKTTTLYAFLRRVSTTENKIITIEDPIEYHLTGINQTQVEPEKGYTFLSGLRSALRQDPDIIMVGEIRDAETAKIAVNAALTGHLVFSTLHTNNAAGTIPRLIDLGVNPKIIDSALNVAMAQRLVRKLCPACKKAAAPSPADQKTLEAVTARIKAKRPEAGLPPATQIWTAVGCAECHQSGYRGRIGIFEAILMKPEIAALLDGHPSEAEIRQAAAGQNILEMVEDGVAKVLAGVTTLEEVRRTVEL